jgi:release factor glutamine methyltransferase
MQKCENINYISIQGLLDWAKDLIAKCGHLTFQAPSLEARLLFSFATAKSHTWLVKYANDSVLKHISNAQVECYIAAVNQRLNGKPIAYILGTQDFWSLTLKVSECTLIPRQDTETLVEMVLLLPLPTKACVLDLGTGTGAIALSLAKERAEWKVLGIDNILEAVELARENSRLNKVEASFLHSNWFSALNSHDGPVTFDVIVTNPPYVEQDSQYVRQGDLRFEPLSALVSGKDGLDDIRDIITQAQQYLNDHGYLVIEHGNTQYKIVQALMSAAGFTDVKSVLDINQIERITLGKYRSFAASGMEDL